MEQIITQWICKGNLVFFIINFKLYKLKRDQFCMNQSAMNAIKLSILIQNFLKGKNNHYVTLPNVQQFFNSTKIDKLNSVNMYRMISDDQNNKLTSIMRIIDSKLLNHTKCFKVKDEVEENNHINDVLFNIFRLKTLINNNLSYQQCLLELRQTLLTQNQFCKSQILALCSILECVPHVFSHNFDKLINTIFDLLIERLSVNSHQIHYSFIESFARSMSYSHYKIPANLNLLINSMLDKNMPNFDYQQLIMLANYKRTKSNAHLYKLGQLQTSPIKKRIIYKIIFSRLHKGLQMNQWLPGRMWTNSYELQQAMGCVKSLAMKQKFIDIFGVEGELNSLQINSQCGLQKPQFLNYYLQNIFFFVKNAYHPLQPESVCRIVRVFKSFFMTSSSLTPSIQFFQLLTHINLFHMQLILFEFELLKYEVAGLSDLIQQMLVIVSQKMSLQYIKNHDYKDYKFNDKRFIYSFIYNQLTMNLKQTISKRNSQQTNVKAYLTLQKINIFLASQTKSKQTKEVFSQLNRLIAFQKFVKAVCSSKKIQLGTTDCILSSQTMSQDEIIYILQSQGQKDLNIDDNFKKTINQTYKVVKKAILQPNLSIQYAVIDKKQNKLIAVFDYKGLVATNHLYEVKKTINQNVVTSNSSNETIYGSWQRQFVSCFYNCQYFYCQSEQQLGQKMFSILKKNGNE